jgi:hypothetical protein
VNDPDVHWCEECELYECGYCYDFTSEWDYEVAAHSTKCPDRSTADDRPGPDWRAVP